MGAFAIIYNGLVMKRCERSVRHCFFGRKGRGTKTASYETVPSQANGTVPEGGGKGGDPVQLGGQHKLKSAKGFIES